MLYCAIMFAAAGIIAGIFGFPSTGASAGAVARVSFFVFLVAFLVTATAASLS